jgi:hypothetical protein
LHLKDDDDSHSDVWQLPNLIPAKQLKGVHVACSQTGLIEESLTFDVESEDPNDVPETKMKELPVDGTLDPEAKILACTKSHE